MNYLADKDKNPSAITLLQNLQHHTATLKPISFFSLSSFLVANLQMQALSNKGSLSLVAEMGNGRNPFGCCWQGRYSVISLQHWALNSIKLLDDYDLYFCYYTVHSVWFVQWIWIYLHCCPLSVPILYISLVPLALSQKVESFVLVYDLKIKIIMEGILVLCWMPS